jgi:hypothetical protein
MSARMRLVMEPAGDQRHFDHQVDIAPEAEAGADGARVIEPYVRILE